MQKWLTKIINLINMSLFIKQYKRQFDAFGRDTVYLGIDIGTSGIKVVLCDESQNIVGQASAPLTVQHPAPLWSEQNPQDWWNGVETAISSVRNENPSALSAVKAIGLSGQMHGAVLLDSDDQVLRPAILWNDGRSAEECLEIEKAEPRSREISGNIAMPGFTAPKLLWVAKHEPEIFARVAKVLLPKDYIRFRMTGEYVSEMSDAAGTLWLDVAKRDWSEALLKATRLTPDQMPRLVEGSESPGKLRDDIAKAWGVPGAAIVAGGAGDNAAGAAGIGAITPGRAFLSLGTSGVLFLANEKFSPNPSQAVHAFCHCLPNTWHQMSVILSAASCLSWITQLTGAANEQALIQEISAAGDQPGDLYFLPYLSGERTPHNNPNAQGVFFGLTHSTDRAAMGRAVLEGVAYAFKDGLDALLETGAKIDVISVIGGGERSELWGQILASVLDYELCYHYGGEVGPAFGAARLARLSVSAEDPSEVCTAPAIKNTIKPDINMVTAYKTRHAKYRRLYELLKTEFPA